MGKKKPPKKSPPKRKKKSRSGPSVASVAPYSASVTDSDVGSPPAPVSVVVESLLETQAVKLPPPASPAPKSAPLSPEMESDVATVKVAVATVPEPTKNKEVLQADAKANQNIDLAQPKATSQSEPVEDPSSSWCDRAKGLGKKLQKKGTPFTLPSGELCLKIPNSVIEKNRKSWECFVIGQFYHDPPSQGTIYNIVNGIWSRGRRDITVSKLEGFAFLFRIPNASTRSHVVKQRLWQLEGQTMFVDHWEPGVVPTKPELSSAPIWLELRNVPFQFFNEDGLERIAGLVGHPKFLHPNTANKTVLDVAKVFTIIDPREPLPEAVNVQFETGDIARILVSSPWMPPVCEHCHEIGHMSKRCKRVSLSCAICKSTSHTTENCTRVKVPVDLRKKSRRHKTGAPTKEWMVREPHKDHGKSVEINAQANTGLIQGDSSGLTPAQKSLEVSVVEQTKKDQVHTDGGKSSDVEHDSSDTFSADSEDDPGDSNKFIEVQYRRTKKKNRGVRSSQH